MQKGITLQALAAKIEGKKKDKKDYIVDTATSLIEVRNEAPVLTIPQYGSYPILETAHRQISERTGIPGKYYDRMRTEAPGLLASNINTWFQAKPRKNMARTLSGDCRAFLSDRYQRIEDEEIANAALPVLADFPDVQIRSCEITDRRLYIHFTVPRIAGEVKRGDVVEAGGIISNSEVGMGAASVSGLLWRLICLNGMKTSDQFRRTHVGRQVDDNEALWSDDTRAADDRTILLKVRDMVRAVLDEARFKVNLERLQGLSTAKVSGNPVKLVEVLADKVGANETEQGDILRALIEGADLSAWGVVNAVTAQAHKALTYERAVEFESMGGQLLDLPKTEWKELLAAA